MHGFKRVRFGGLWIAGLGLGVCGCADDAPGETPAPSAETVESRPGIVQVGAEKGPVLEEVEACELFRAGLLRNQERLDCEAAPVLDCPQLIQPLAALSCWTFSKASVDQCVANYDAADECAELLPGACVLTAVLPTVLDGCGDGDAAVTNEGDGGSETHETDVTVIATAPDGSVTADPVPDDAGETLDAAVRSGDSDAAAGPAESTPSQTESDASTVSSTTATSTEAASSAAKPPDASATLDAGQ